MSTRSIVDPWNFQTYTYDWNEAEDPSPDQEMSILQKERERRKIQPPPRVDADSLLSTLEPHPAIARPQRTPPPIEGPPPTLEDRMRAQPSFGAAVKFGLQAAMDPVGAATGDPNWPKRVIGDLVGPPDEPTDTSEMDPGTAFLARAKDVGKRVLRTGAEKSLGLASSPVTAYFGIPGVATSIPGRLAAGAFGVQAAAGGGDALGRAQALVDAGKDWSDPEVVDLLTSAGIDLGAAPFMLGHARTGVADIGRLPFVEKGANYIDPIARELGYLDDPFANLRSPMQHEGLPPTDWMVRNGYRMKKGGWYNDEGKLVSHEQINADFQADKALRANAPKLEFKQPDIQAGFEDWRNLPENRKFFGGRLSPERMKDALTAYNQYATEFAARKAASVPQASAAPKSVEEVMGDVGELPTEEPTGDFQKDVLDKPAEAAPVAEETVQPANVSEPAPIPEEPVIETPPEPTPVAETPPPIAAEPEGIPVRHAIWNPELFRQMEEASRGAAPESPPIPPEEPLPEPPARTSGLLDDIENIPAEAGPIEQPHAAPEALAKDHPLVKAYREDPNHIALESYDKELSPTEAGFLLQEEPGLAKYPWMKRALGLEEPTSPEGSVQQGAGTIESGTVQPETPAAPGKIVPGPETIVQEASSKPSVQPEAPKATSPTVASSPEAQAVVAKMTLDNVLEELYPGKESWTKSEIVAARKELMTRLRGKKTEKAAAATDALHQKIEETVAPGETPPGNVAKVKETGKEGAAPKLPLGNPGIASRIFLDLRTNLGKIHPHLARWAEKFQRDAELPAMNAIAQRRVLTENLSGGEKNALIRILDEKGAEELAVANELKDNVKIQALLKADPTLQDVLTELHGSPDLVDKAASLRDLLDQVHQAAEPLKVAVGYRQHYFPHYFKEGGFRPNVQPKAMPRTGTSTRRMSKLEKQRLTMRTDYIKDLNVLDEYFMQAYQRISEAENFGKRHEKLARWFNQTEGVDPRVAQYFDKGIQRITGNEEPSWIRGALGKARRYQALSDLGLAAPLQLGQATHTSAYGGVMRSLEAVGDMTREQKAIAMRALRSGALTPDIGIESLGAARGGGVTSGKFLWGIPTMDKAMRVHSFRVGELLYRDAVAGNSGAIRSLERLGIKDVSKVTADQVGKALSDKTQFKTGHLDLPLWSTSPLGRTATMYTSFMYQHTKFMGQLFKNPVQNAPAIARFAVMGALLGEGVGDIRAGMKLRNPVIDEKFRKKEAEWIEVLRNRRIPITSPAKRLVQNYALLGGAGLFQTYFERLAAPDVTAAGVAGGPLASNAEDLLREVARQKKLKEKGRAAGRWALEQVPIAGYELGAAVFPKKKRRTPDPLLDVEY